MDTDVAEPEVVPRHTDETRLLAVAHGVRLLDTHDNTPENWREVVNVDLLNMHSDHNCVLGQLFGIYGEGLEQLDLYDHMTAENYGFVALDPNWIFSGEETHKLTPIWRGYLRGEITLPVI